MIGFVTAGNVLTEERLSTDSAFEITMSDSHLSLCLSVCLIPAGEFAAVVSVAAGHP